MHNEFICIKDVAMHLPLYQVDAFTSRLFAGNPARGRSVAELDK